MDRKRPSKWDVQPSKVGAGGDQKKARLDVQQPAASSGGYEGFETGYQGLASLYQGYGDKALGGNQNKSRGANQNNSSNKWGNEENYSGQRTDYGDYGKDYGNSYVGQGNNYDFNNKDGNYSAAGQGDAYYNQGGNYGQGGNYEGQGNNSGGQWSNYGAQGQNSYGGNYNGPGGDYQGQDNSYGGQGGNYGNYDDNYGSHEQWGYDGGYEGFKVNNFNKSQSFSKDNSQNKSGKSLLGKPPIPNQQKRSLGGLPPPPPPPGPGGPLTGKPIKNTNKKKPKKSCENNTNRTPSLIASNKSANGIGYSNPYAGYDVEEEEAPSQPIMSNDYGFGRKSIFSSQRGNNYIDTRFGQGNKNRNRTPVGNKISIEQKVATMTVVPQTILTMKEIFLIKIKDMILEKQKSASKKPVELLSASVLEQKHSMIVITVDISDYDKEGMAPYFNGRPVPIAGYVTEIRCNGMSLGLTYSVTKAKIKEILGAEIVTKLTAQEGVVVKAVDRSLKDKVYKDLVVVMASKSEEAPILPCFLRAPPGTKEYHEMIAEQQIKNKERKAKLKGKTGTKQPEPESPAKSESSVTSSEEIKVSNKEIDGDPVQFLKNMLVDKSVEIELAKHFTPELIEYKRMFIQHLKEVMLLNKDENPAVKMNNSGQLCGENLQYIYTDLKTVSFSNYPKFFKVSEAPSGSGYFCELRIRGVFISMVFATNKFLAKNKAAIEAIKLFQSHSLNVVAIARGTSDNKHFPELVLTTVANSELKSLSPEKDKLSNLELVGREIPDFILPEHSKFSREDPFENLKAKKGGKNSIVVVQRKLKIKNVHVADEIPVEYLQYKEGLLQKVIQNLKNCKDSKTMGEISKLSKSLGGIRDSLVTIIRDVAELNKDDIKTCFDGRPVPIAGYLCEIRMNETSLGIGYHVKKHKVKESTITKINETLLTPGATIVPTIRKCMDTSYKDLVLTLTPDAKIESPVFLHPPRGTPEYNIVIKNNSKSSTAADIDYPMKEEAKESNIIKAEPCLEIKTEKATEDSKESLKSTSGNSEPATASSSSGGLTTIDKYKHKFIMFTKSGGQESYTPQEAESTPEEESFDPKTFYTPEYIEYKQRFIDHFVEVINQKKSDCKGSNELLSKAAQICQENPKFLFTDITTVAKQNYPDIIKKRADYISVGYLCEIRFQDIYLALAYSLSKTGVKEKAAEAALKVLTADKLHVIPMTRRWNGKKYADLVLSNNEEGRQDLPMFYSPPGSVKKDEEEKTAGKVGKDGKKEGKSSTVVSKEPAKEALLRRSDFYHCGPMKTGKALENFAIVMDDGVDNPTCVFNTSAQFSKMAVDYFYEKIPGWKDDQLITLFIEGIPIADARGRKRILKQKVSVQGLQCLNQFCHVVLTNKDLINANDVVRRSDIKVFPEDLRGSSGNRQRDDRGGMLPPKKSDTEKGTIGGVGESMLKNMGWREGGGIGDKFKAKTEVIKVTNDSVNREGLGAKNTNPYNITRDEADTVLKEYAASSQTDELVFSSELNYDERLTFRQLAKRYNLNDRLENVPFHGYKKIFLIISKKLDSDYIINKLLADGSYGKYQMMAAAGAAKMDKDEVIKKYLNHQKYRKEQGFPKEIDELVENRKKEEGRGNKFNYKATPKDTIRYSNVDNTTTFDRFGKVKTAEKAVMDRLANTKEKGFKFNQQPDGFEQQLKQWEECGWEDMMDKWQDNNMDQGWNSGNHGWNENSDWNNRNFGNSDWNDRNFDNPEWNDMHSGIPEWNANMDQGWNEGGGEWNANMNRFDDRARGGNGNPEWNANMNQWNEASGREWNSSNFNQQKGGGRDSDNDLAQLQLRTWELAQNSSKQTGQGVGNSSTMNIKMSSKSKSPGKSSSQSSTKAVEPLNMDDIMSNVDKWIKRKVEGSNAPVNEVKNSSINDIDDIPMPFSNPVEVKKKDLPRPVPLMQIHLGGGSEQDAGSVQNFPRRGGGILGQGPGGWANSDRGGGGFRGGFGGSRGGGSTSRGGSGDDWSGRGSFGGSRGGGSTRRGGSVDDWSGSNGGSGRGGVSGEGVSRDDWSEFLKEQYEQFGEEDAGPAEFSRGRGRGSAWNSGRGGRW